MKTSAAIASFLRKDNPVPVTVAEIRDLKSVCTDEEWKKFGQEAAELIGETIEE